MSELICLILVESEGCLSSFAWFGEEMKDVSADLLGFGGKWRMSQLICSLFCRGGKEGEWKPVRRGEAKRRNKWRAGQALT